MAAVAAVLAAAGLLAACGDAPPAPLPTPAIHTPRWAFSPWISKDISTTDDSYDFVRGFRDRDIPVGVLVIDSPWETNYTTFVPNPERYHDFGRLVADLRADGVRVVLWTTQMINSTSVDLEIGGDAYDGPSPNLAEARARGYLVNGGQEYFWWKGFGAGLDFFNPEAVRWWHAQQDLVLDLGVSGWKLDFGESYIEEPELTTHAGVVTHQEYSEEYYRDFWAYGVHRRGAEEFVTMVRPYDKSYQFPGRFFARPEHAPVCWVGDNRRDFVGLADALDHIFRSAQAGYVVLGSDIGGYLDHDDVDLSVGIPWDTEVFARWTAVGAFSPFMQLHGRANITPWTVPDHTDEVVALYRYYATLHQELVPFFYSLAEEAYAGGGTIVVPQGDEASWPGDYRYLLGQAFLVAPILAAGGQRDVLLPAGARYFDFNDPQAAPLEGGTTVGYDAAAWDRLPVFVREGAIVPLDVASAVTGLGTAASAGHLTVLAWPGATESTFVLHDTDGEVVTLTAGGDGTTARLALSRAPRPVLARLRLAAAPTSVTAGGAAVSLLGSREELDAAATGAWVEPGTDFVWIKAPAQEAPLELVAVE
jgi:alpha-glucosidase (family GH31 glycosyl hydrolase)